jgi:hypothetical protein
LFEELHEGGEVVDAGVEGGEAAVEFGVLLVVVKGEEVVAETEGGGVAGEALEVVEDLVEGGGGLGFGRDVDEEVEVIGHEGEGEDTDAAEVFAIAEEGEEVAFFGIAEDEALVDDAGDAVVKGVAIGGEFEAWEAHAGRVLEGKGCHKGWERKALGNRKKRLTGMIGGRLAAAIQGLSPCSWRGLSPYRRRRTCPQVEPQRTCPRARQRTCPYMGAGDEGKRREGWAEGEGKERRRPDLAVRPCRVGDGGDGPGPGWGLSEWRGRSAGSRRWRGRASQFFPGGWCRCR